MNGSPKFTVAVEAWLAGFEVRAWPPEATHTYAQIRATLERGGRLIGGMDLLIASHAVSETTGPYACAVKHTEDLNLLTLDTIGNDVWVFN